MILNIFIALAIILVLIGVCLFFAIKMNKIYSSNDKHLGKLAPNEKVYDLTKEKDKEEVKGILCRDFKTDIESIESELRYRKAKQYRKSRKTIRISEVAEAFYIKYPNLTDINVKYAFMKLATISKNNSIKPIKFKKVGKTFYLTIRNVLDLELLLRNVPKDDSKYSRGNLGYMLEIARDLLVKKIVPEKDKYLWRDYPNDMLDRF